VAEERPYPRNLSSDELICLPFLDTEPTEQLPAANAELEARGYPGWLVRLLRGIALPGLWYQILAWEWDGLGAYDVCLGYGAILVVASPFVAMLSSLLFGALFWGVVPLAAGLLLFAVAWLGLDRRRRARERAAARHCR
jgi:hypothetical protein